MADNRENKCPYCGADLQEGAQFCLYCMKNLTEKKDVTPMRRSRGAALTVILVCIVLAVAVACAVIIPKIGDNGEETEAPLQSGEGEEQEEPGDWPIITTIDDFMLRAIYLSGKNDLSGLWDPDGFVHTHTLTDEDGDEWKVYDTDVTPQGAALKVHFCEDGIEIVTSVTGLTEETMDDGLMLVSCAVSSVYNSTFSNLEDVLADDDAYSREDVAAGEDIMTLAELTDPAAKKQDEGTAMQAQRIQMHLDEQTFPGQTMFIEFRTRTYNGQTLYDIILFHTQTLPE